MRDLRDILSALVAAEEAGGEPETFTLFYSADGPHIVGHRGWPEEAAPPSSVEVDRLEERGWVQVSLREGAGRHFALTFSGLNAASAYARQRSAAAVSAVVLDWAVVNPVLERFYRAYLDAGAPEYGVESEAVLHDLEDPRSARPALRELVRAGYLEETADNDQSDIPTAVRLTPLALQTLAGWPGSSAEAALAELVRAIDQEIEITSDVEKRSTLLRVRDGLLGAARDVAIAYLEKKAGV